MGNGLPFVNYFGGLAQGEEELASKSSPAFAPLSVCRFQEDGDRKPGTGDRKSPRREKTGSRETHTKALSCRWM